MRSALDTVVLFRWDSSSQEILHAQAQKRCMSDSSLIRRLLDSWISALKTKQNTKT